MGNIFFGNINFYQFFNNFFKELKIEIFTVKNALPLEKVNFNSTYLFYVILRLIILFIIIYTIAFASSYCLFHVSLFKKV